MILGKSQNIKIRILYKRLENANVLYREYVTTGASDGNKKLQIIKNTYCHCSRALAQVHFSPISRKFRLMGQMDSR